MNNKVIIAVVIVAVVAIGGFVAYTMMGTRTATPTPTAGTNASNAQASGTPTSLKDLMTSTRPETCQLNDSGNKGTVYVSNGKVRIDSTMTQNGQTVSTHVILDKDSFYTWVEGMKTGYKMSLSSINTNTNTNTGGQTVDMNRKTNVVCGPWIVDESRFTLPSTVTFSEVNTALPTTNTSTKTNKCAACDTVPASYKSQCLSSLGCQ